MPSYFRNAKFPNWLGVMETLRESEATEGGGGGGEGVGVGHWGVPPPMVGSFFILGVEIVQFGAYL